MAWISQRRTISTAHARGRRRRAAHATDDVLGERDPDLLVVLELGVHAQVGERRDPRGLVALRVEAEPVRVPHPPVRLGPELRPGPGEGEIDVEQDGSQHDGFA